MNKILILGSNSFSGASMTNYLLKKKFLVYGTYNQKKPNIYLNFKKNIKKNNFKMLKINLLKRSDIFKLIKIIKKEKPNYILDFASLCMVNESWSLPQRYFDINVLSKIHILNEIKKLNFIKKYIYISTPEIFGSQNYKIIEKNKLFNPSTPYATSKLSCELYINNLIKNFKFNGIIARFSNFYGPGQPYYRLIPKIILSILKKKKFPIHGDGKSKRNYIFSEDFCSGIYKIIKKGNVGKTYHFSGNKLYSVIDIIKKVAKLMGKNFNIITKKSSDRKGKDLIYNISSAATKKELDWNCNTTIDNGIKKVIEFSLINFKKIKNLPIEYIQK
tara:strand:+ start:31376 stop:32368 length:993 start_codon:yes stop_codon:yes gene_type:complete